MSLKLKTISGVKWTALSTVVTNIIQIGQIAVLARLLSRADFGLMSMMMVVIGFSQAFADMGISKAIIYRQDATREQLSSLYWLNVFAGILVFSAVLAARPLIVGFYNEPRLSGLIFYVALIFPITTFGQQFQMLLQKELVFNKLSKIEVISVASTALVAIYSAFSGQGVFSLIWGQLSGVGVKSFLLMFSCRKEWFPALRFKFADLKGYLRFGLFQMGEKSVNYLSANVDYLIIGRFLGAEILGIYTLAYQLVVVPITKINPIITKVAFPVFAKVQKEDSVLRRGCLEMTSLIAFAVFPLLIGLAVTAPLLVPVLYGPKWMPAVYLIQILSIVGMARSLGNPLGSIYYAKGRVDITFFWNLTAFIINVAIFRLVINNGVYTVAYAFAILSIFYFFIGQILLKHIINLEPKEYLAVLGKPLILSISMGAVVALALFFMSPFLEMFLLLFILIFFGGVSYVFMLFVFERQYMLSLFNMLFKRQDRQPCAYV